jgi:hypothetical protein
MSGRGTRRAFLGGGAAFAAGLGLAKLPGALGRERHTLAFDTADLAGGGSAPEFGTLRPGATNAGALTGRLLERGSARAAGRLGITPVTTDTGVLQVHTLDLASGQIVALGPDTDSVFPITSGTGAFAGATGTLTVRDRRAGLALDVDLEL